MCSQFIDGFFDRHGAGIAPEEVQHYYVCLVGIPSIFAANKQSDYDPAFLVKCQHHDLLIVILDQGSQEIF